MPTNKPQQRATARYNLKNYDRIELRVSKGQKEELKAHTERMDESLNSFINRAINETLERDNAALIDAQETE